MRPGQRRGWAEPGSSPRAGQGAGPTAPRALAGCRWSSVGFGQGSYNGGSPGEPAGEEQRRKKRGKAGRQTAEEEEEEEAPWNAEGPGE